MASTTSRVPPSARLVEAGEARRPGRGFLGALLAGAVGLGAFAAVCGFRVLDASEVGWLKDGDPAQYLLGWTYFRASPWTSPPGANPGYGLEIASSVFFSDSIPLFALLFKALGPLADVPQYFGWWLLLCFVGQGAAGWLLMGLAVRGAAARLLGAALLCCAPPFLWRLHGHYSLLAHWLVLLALWLALAPPRPKRWPFFWGGLLLLASLVHAYLLAMAAALWAADLLRRAISAAGGVRRSAAPWRLAVEALAVPALVAGGLWAAGFFVVRGGLSAGGFGTYAMNLLAPLDGDGHWSRVLPDLPDAPGREAGSNFLGLGLLGLHLAALLAWLSRPALPRPRLERAPLLAALAALAAFALSHRIAFGGAEWLVLPAPPWALRAADALRASERMFWPAFYALALLSVAVVARRWGPRAATALLAAALAAQAADGSAAWARLRAGLDPPGGRAWEPLRGPFWDEAARLYDRVRTVPLANKAPGWEVVGRWASTNGLPTDAVYLARVDGRALAASRAATEEALAGGRAEPGTLYVLNTPQAAFSLAAVLDPAADLLAEVDGLRVFAPGWKRSRPVPRGARELRPDGALPAVALGVPLRFDRLAQAPDHSALVSGWSVPEPHGRWNDGRRATVAFRLPPVPPGAVEGLDLWAEGTAFLPPQRPEQRVRVAVSRGAGCAETFAEWRFGGGGEPATGAWRSVAMPACAAAAEGPPDGLARVRFEFPGAARPSELGLSADSRGLAFAIAGLVLLRRGETPP